MNNLIAFWRHAALKQMSICYVDVFVLLQFNSGYFYHLVFHIFEYEVFDMSLS